jgi:DNA polymerase III alpha subunit
MDEQFVFVDADIDIDLADRNTLLSKIDNIPASIIEENNLSKHKTGVYFQSVPIDPLSGYCSVDHKKAYDLGYFKVDFLNVNVLSDLESNDCIYDLINKDPDWTKLQDPDIVKQLFHIHNHFNILNEMKPSNVEQLAAVLAIIRPSKRYLLGKSWSEVLEQVWTKPENEEYFFKKSHAIGYALTIVMQLNLHFPN